MLPCTSSIHPMWSLMQPFSWEGPFCCYLRKNLEMQILPSPSRSASICCYTGSFTVIRIEKFILANELGLDEVALFHVAQLAWLAGLLVPQAMRAALLPVLGETRNQPAMFNQHLGRVESICFALVPIGLASGAAIVWILLPIGFPSEYFDGTLGASARDIFMLLLQVGHLQCFQSLHTLLCRLGNDHGCSRC